MPGRRVFLIVVAGLLCLCVAVAAFSHAWVSAQWRAVVVLSTVLEAPVLSPATDLATGEPLIEERRVAGVPATVARPPGEGPWPALLFVNGATPRGRDEPALQLLAEGLARAGYVVYVPDLPGLREGEISGETLEVTVEAATEIADSPEARDGRVGFVGVSVGGSLALLAASDPAMERRTTVVAGLAPYADLREVTRIATTRTYRDGGEPRRYETPDYLRLVAARSLAAMISSEEDRRALLAMLPDSEHYSPPEEETPDPLAALPAFRVVFGDDLGPEASAALDLLVNEDPERFDRLYDRLEPRMREESRALSPVYASPDAPVELISAPRDRYFPVPQMRDLTAAEPEARLTVTPAVSHSEPVPSLGDVPELLSLNAFVLRSLKEASSTEPSSAEPSRRETRETAGPACEGECTEYARVARVHSRGTRAEGKRVEEGG